MLQTTSAAVEEESFYKICVENPEKEKNTVAFAENAMIKVKLIAK